MIRFFLAFGFILLSNSLTISAQDWKDVFHFSPEQTLQKIRFRSSGYGLTVGSLYNGSTKNIHRTIDGAKHWADVSSGYTSMRFMDIFFVDDSLVYMSGNEGLILRSRNGGISWETLNTETKEQLWGIYFQSKKIGYAVGSNGIIIRTNNGGDTWEKIPSGIQNLFYAVTFTSSGLGFASGSNILMKTIDGGDSWDRVTDFPFQAPADWIRSIKFVTDKIGFACADIGRIYKTMDGGDHWERLDSPTDQALFDVDFVDEMNGMIVGFSGGILSTSDGGISWNLVQSPLGTENLYSLDMVSSSEAYICSHLCKILKLQKTIGTNNWTAIDISVYPNPVREELFIQSEKFGLDKPMRYTITNLYGKIVSQSFIRSSNMTIPMNDFTQGEYILQLKDNNNVIISTQNIVKD